MTRVVRCMVSFSAALVLAVTSSSLTPAHAYEVIDVQHGGTIEGTVTLDGPVPEPKGFNLITFPDPAYCGRISNGSGWRLLHDFAVGHHGGLRNAIVLLEGVDAGKPFEVSVPLIEARDCMFQPFMTIVRNGHAVEVINMDPVMHDIQGYETSPEAGARVFVQYPFGHESSASARGSPCDARPCAGASLVGPIYLNKGRRTFYMQCGFHAYMESWAMAVNNPYYALTDAEGRFSIVGIPPSTYQTGGLAPEDRTGNDKDGCGATGWKASRATLCCLLPRAIELRIRS